MMALEANVLCGLVCSGRGRLWSGMKRRHSLRYDKAGESDHR